MLLGLGDWLKANGEAIYETRPWKTAAEGPTAEPSGGFAARDQFLDLQYTVEDIRYTASKDGNTVYAILLGVPEPDTSCLLKLLKEDAASIESIHLLSEEILRWKVTAEGVQVSIPENLSVAGLTAIFKVNLR